MRILLAGATGVIGRLLVPMLLCDGHQVLGTSRTEAGVAALRELGATGLRMGAFDRPGVHETVSGAGPDVVVHLLTALSELDFAANARIRREGTRNLVDAAQTAGVSRVVAQSISWAYVPGADPADEATPLDTDAPAPRSGSVGAVAALEDAVAELDRHVILRCGTLYGPGTWYSAGGRAAAQLHAGELTANGGVGSLVHVADVASAFARALDWPNGPVNVVDDEPAPASEWLPALAAALGEPAPPSADGQAGWERGASNARARGLGWTPRYPSWRHGFAALG